MFVAQLTDLHLGSEDDGKPDANRARFQSCVDTLRTMARPPDLYLVTGDITERGDEDGYRFFLRTMRSLEQPWLCLLGNHDVPAGFASALAQEPDDGWRRIGTARVADWRIVTVETATAGMDGGYFNDARAERLAAVLDQDRTAPTIVAMHHPPVASGVGWIDPPADAGWIARFGAVIARFPQVRQILCGHAHMAVATQFRGIPLCIAPATASQLWPDFAPFDGAEPDGRLMVVDGQPGFALHRLANGSVATTFAAPATGQVRLRHGPRASGRVGPRDILQMVTQD